MDLFGIILSLILVIGVIGVIFNILVWLYKHIILLYNYFANKEQSNNSPNTQKKIIDLFEVRRNELINSPEFRKNIEQASNFEKEIEILKQGYIRYSSKEAILNNYNLLFKEISSAQYQKYKITEFKSFYHTYSNLNSLVASWNQGYVKSEISRCSWLDNIDGKTLDPQQRRAVVVNEDNNLVLAGAGSGKTLTISAKVKYLVEEKKVDPADILLITFTRKAAAEMQDRISNKLKIHVEASTFHKFGLDIYKKVLGSRPDVFDDLESVVDTYFKKDIFLHKKAVKNVIEFFGLYINVPTNYDKINCLGQVIEREKNLDLETIKSKVETEIQESTKNRKTINGEHVKSIEEVIIANHLYLNGINYEYEYLYPFETEDKFRKRYRPDFYLPDYDLYLEHFGIDKNGRVPWLSKIEEQKYLDDMAWKRALHKKNGTTLIETYSYFNKYGHLLIELDKILKKNGVT